MTAPGTHVSEDPEKVGREILRGCTGSYQHETAIPNRLEGGSCDPFESPRRPASYKCNVPDNLAQDQEATVAESRNPGQRHAGQSFPICRAGARVKPLLIRAAQHLFDANRRCPAAAEDLLRAIAHTMKAQHERQDDKSGIHRREIIVLRLHRQSSIMTRRATGATLVQGLNQGVYP